MGSRQLREKDAPHPAHGRQGENDGSKGFHKDGQQLPNARLIPYGHTVSGTTVGILRRFVRGINFVELTKNQRFLKIG